MNEMALTKVEPLWTVKDLGAFLNSSAKAVYKLVERKQVPHIRFRRKVMFDPHAIRIWVNQHTVKGA